MQAREIEELVGDGDFVQVRVLEERFVIEADRIGVLLEELNQHALRGRCRWVGDGNNDRALRGFDGA